MWLSARHSYSKMTDLIAKFVCSTIILKFWLYVGTDYVYNITTVGSHRFPPALPLFCNFGSKLKWPYRQNSRLWRPVAGLSLTSHLQILTGNTARSFVWLESIFLFSQNEKMQWGHFGNWLLIMSVWKFRQFTLKLILWTLSRIAIIISSPSSLGHCSCPSIVSHLVSSVLPNRGKGFKMTRFFLWHNSLPKHSTVSKLVLFGM